MNNGRAECLLTTQLRLLESKNEQIERVRCLGGQNPTPKCNPAFPPVTLTKVLSKWHQMRPKTLEVNSRPLASFVTPCPSSVAHLANKIETEGGL